MLRGNTVRKIALQRAFDSADEFVMENTSCPTLADMAHGWCNVWAKAVKKKAPFVDIREWQGHTFIVYDGIAYDSDTSDEGFEPPE
jgi:hypothetical protein